MSKFFTIVGVAVAALAIVVLMSMITSAFWYMIDDRLAEYTGIEQLGQLPFTFVWPATIFIGMLFKGSSSSSSSSK